MGYISRYYSILNLYFTIQLSKISNSTMFIALSSVLYTKGGYVGVFTFGLVVLCLALLYGIFFIKETKVKLRQKIPSPHLAHENVSTEVNNLL